MRAAAVDGLAALERVCYAPSMPPVDRSVKSPSLRGAPRGRAAARAAIIDAARSLFAEKGYAGVSVREIADRARVNHGLVHRHFGAKAEVLRAVLQGMFDDVGALARTALDPRDPDFLTKLLPLAATRKQDWQVLMRAVLDGFDFQSAGFTFPTTAAVLDHVASVRGRRDRAAREIAGAVIAGALGWLLLETYLAPVLDLDDQDYDALRRRMAARFARLV